METYNASEGFFAIQNDPASDDLLLMLDYGVYYEFLPVRDLDDPSRAVPLEGVAKGINYAMTVSYTHLDAHALGQVDEVQVLDLGDHFLHAEPFGQHRGQNVRLGAARHGHEGVHIAQSLFDHRFGIAPVFVDNQCFFELLGQFVGLFGRIDVYKRQPEQGASTRIRSK